MSDPRPDPPYAGDERATLVGFLDFLRATLRLKASGLTAEQLGARLAPSTLTLGGLLSHMAWVEDWWFGRGLLGADPAPPWDTGDWDADADWEFSYATGRAPEELLALFDDAVAASDAIIAAASLDQPLARPQRSGEVPSLRWVLVHMIEEYARHCGHADLIRESIDGTVGQ